MNIEKDTKKYFRKVEVGFSTWCPGCNRGHIFDKRWTLDEENKTVTP